MSHKKCKNPIFDSIIIFMEKMLKPDMKHLTKSHRHASNVLIVFKFEHTLVGIQTNPNKSQKKLKIDPTLGYHI
jgi:hypothetical protein